MIVTFSKIVAIELETNALPTLFTIGSGNRCRSQLVMAIVATLRDRIHAPSSRFVSSHSQFSTGVHTDGKPKNVMASQQQSRDTHKTLHDRRRRKRVKAFEHINDAACTPALGTTEAKEMDDGLASESTLDYIDIDYSSLYPFHQPDLSPLDILFLSKKPATYLQLTPLRLRVSMDDPKGYPQSYAPHSGKRALVFQGLSNEDFGEFYNNDEILAALNNWSEQQKKAGLKRKLNRTGFVTAATGDATEHRRYKFGAELTKRTECDLDLQRDLNLDKSSGKCEGHAAVNKL
ncbi:hypothetical protein EVAR_50563_1 [Eumeta japonica]|uniref:Uncharacterized protein n=1 Tax=Eumeta variegata TaxID=151549 RepID=A0A4C1ZF98_EUMVA|nr:hypothetical protein EVAR_50563_1 [Eumeta japonica]